MKKYVLVVVLCFSFFAAGCASKHMQAVEPAAVPAAVADNESALVLLRATSFGGAVQAPVVESNNGTLTFVGIVSSGARVLYKTTPGKHFFAVGGESSNLLEADFEGGKTYYAYVSPRMGFMKARFVFVPVTKEEALSEKFRKDFDWCKWYVNTPQSHQWFTENRESMQEKLQNAMQKEERAVIRREYGVTTPLR